MLPAVAVELFPLPFLGIEDVLDPAQARTPCFLTRATRARRTESTRFLQMIAVITTKMMPSTSAATMRAHVICDDGATVNVAVRLKNASRSACSCGAS